MLPIMLIIIDPTQSIKEYDSRVGLGHPLAKK